MIKSITLPIASTANPAAIQETPKTSVWNREIRLGPPLPMKDRFQFYQLLSGLLAAGLGILDALEVLVEQEQKAKLTQLYQALIEALTGGMPLSEAFAQQALYFSSFEVESLRMGEQSGHMLEVLQKLSVYYEKRIKLQRKVMQALSYPMAVILVAGGVLLFMMTFVVPMFEEIFQRFDAELPPITQLILQLSESIQTGYPMGLAGLGILGGALFFVRKTERFRQIMAAILVRIPLLGKLLFKLHLSRFCYTLSLLLKAHVSLDQALALLEKVTRFYPLQRTLGPIRQTVIEGQSLYDALAVHPVYPNYVNRIIKVGEKTANLGTMTENLAQKLEEESEAGIGQLTQFLEPVLIIVLGVMVALILVAMYLPMFELSNAVG